MSDAASAAPVEPALTTASERPSASDRAAWTIDASCFARAGCGLDLRAGTEHEAARPSRGRLTHPGDDFGYPAVRPERVYCDGCDGASLAEVSTTWRPP